MLKDEVQPTGLTPKQIQFTEAILLGQSIKMSAKIAGIGERTAHAWLPLPSVKKALQLGTDALLSSSLNRLQLLSLSAIDRLQELMYDPEAGAAINASCARTLAAKLLDVLSAPAEQTITPGIDWSIFTPDQLAIITPIFAEAEKKRRDDIASAHNDTQRHFV